MSCPTPHRLVSKDNGCIAITRAGTPCPNQALPDAEYCGLHDPKVAKAARIKGGVARARSLVPPAFTAEQAEAMINLQSAREIPGTLEAIARAVATRTLGVREGYCIIQAAGIASRVIDIANLSQRLELLEASLGRRK